VELRPWKTYSSQILHVDLLHLSLKHLSEPSLPQINSPYLPRFAFHKVLCAGNTVVSWAKCRLHQWCGLRPSVLGHLRPKKNRSWSCRSDVVLWNTVLSRSSSWWSWRTQQLVKYCLYSFSILCLEHHYCDQQWRSLT